MRGSGSAEGAIILATAPVFTTIFAVLYKQEEFSVGTLFGAVVAFAGTVLVILGGGAVSHGHLIANLLILVSSVVWAYGAVLMRPLLAKYSPTQALTLSMPGALLALIPYGLIPTLHMDWSAMTPLAWSMLAYISVLAGVVGFLGFYAGVRQIGAARAMMYQYFVSPTTAVFAYLVFGKALTLSQSVGLVIVITGVALASRSRLLAARAASETA
jgi:drug/metabolite transporter (DMT)-like permease